MKRSILSVLFALLLLVGLLAVSAGATEDTGTTETPHTDHCICGGNLTSEAALANHECTTGNTWIALTAENIVRDQGITVASDRETDSKYNMFAATSGCYYLVEDIALERVFEIRPGQNISLCLNGHKLSLSSSAVTKQSIFRVTGGVISICDCAGGGSVESNWTGAAPIANILNGYADASGSTMNLYGGDLVAKDTNTDNNSGVIQVSNNNKNTYPATLNMYGGSISGGTGKLGGCVLGKDSRYAAFNMYGGEISGGTSAGTGGNIYWANGSLNIYGGSITGGTAAGLGQDVYQVKGTYSKVTVKNDVTIGDIYVADGANFTIDALKDSVGISNSHTAHCMCVGNGEGKGEHTCETVEAWIPWGYLSAERTKLPSASGNYYLVSNITLSSGNKELAAGTDIGLCLNGYKISQSVRINARGNLTLTDCKTTGKIVSTASGSYGGIFYVYNTAKITIFAGTYDASGTTIRNGGIAHIGNDKAAYMDIYGGTLIGATLTVSETATNDPRGTKGGILDITVSSVVNMYGGSLEGGSALVTSETTQSKYRPMGGCIALYSGTFNMYGGSVSGGEAVYGGCIYYRAGTLKIVSGTISGGTADYGGNIYAETAMTLSGGTISGGESTAFGGGNVYGAKAVTVAGAVLDGGIVPDKQKGGSVYSATTFTMTSGSITGGRINGTTSGSDGGCVYAKDVILSGGTITGGLTAAQIEEGLYNARNGGCVAASNSISISGGTLTGGRAYNGGGNVYIPKDKELTVEGANTLIEKGYAYSIGGGNIYGIDSIIIIQDGARIAEGQSNARGGNIYLNVNNSATSTARTLTINGAKLSKGVAKTYGGSIYVPGPHSILIQGATTEISEGESQGNPGGNIYAKFLTMEDGTVTKGTALKGQGGNIYIISGGLFTMQGGKVSEGESSVSSGGNIGVVSTNGTTTVNIEGGIIEKGVAVNGGNIYGFVSGENEKSVIINISGGTITEGTAKSTTGGGGNIAVTANGELNISGTAEITNGQATNNYGGNIYVSNAALSITGGTISGGTAANHGGGIYVHSGEFTLSGGTVQNCQAAAGGGGVFVASAATFTMTGGTVRNCQAVYGGNLFVYGTTADISGGTISGGVSTNQDSSAGGNINVEKKDDTYVGTLNLSGTAVVTGGQATNSDGGNIFINRATMTMTGGTISGGLAEGEKNAKHGGAICVADGSLNISGGTVSGCVASSHGGGIYATENAAVTISGGTFTGNKSTGSGSNGGNLSAEGAVTISGGTFENGSAGNAGGNVSACNATVTGGTFLGGSAKYGGNAAFITGGDSTIENATFTGGEAQLGGAIYVTNNSISLNNVTISDGKANKTKTSSNGGNLYTKANPTTLTNCTVSDGTATYRGGNIYASNGITVTGGSITGGSAKVGEGEKITTNGGNLTAFGGGTFSGVTIADGEGTHGGNIAINDGTYTIENCTISNGNATLKCDGTTNGNGGNLYAIGGSTVTITGCSFSGGEAMRGGSIAAWGRVTIDNTTVDGGHAYFAGGNVMAFGENSSLTLNTGTVLKNGSVTLKGAALYLSEGKHVHTINDGVEIYAGEAGEVAPCVYVDDVQVQLVGAPSMDAIYVAEGIKNYGLIADQLAEEARITLTATKPGMFGCGAEADLAHFVSPQGYILACRNGKLYLDAPTAVYVSDNGSDSNAGSQAAPYKTLNHALSMVADNGTVHIVDILTQATSGTGAGGWAEHGKTFTLTGGEFVTPKERIYLRDNVTFDNLILTMAMSTTSTSSNYGSFFFYCNGFTTVFEDDITTRYLFDGTYMDDSYQTLTYTPSGGTETEVLASCKLYGGANSAYGVIEGTNLTVLGGVWGEIYGGSNDQNITGDVHLTVGGNVNAGVDYVSHTHSGRHVIFGGSRSADIAGTVYMNVIGGQNHTSTFGGSSGNCSIGAVELRATGGNGMAIYGGGKYGVNTVGTINFYYEGATFEQVFGGSISQDLIVTDALNLYITGGTITRRLYGGCWVNREESIFGDWDPQKKVTGIINLYIGENANITCNLNKPSGDSYSDRSIYAHTRYPSNASEEQARLIFQNKAAYDKFKDLLKANDSAMSFLMGSMTAADYICYMGTTVDGYTITAGAIEVEDNVSNALDLPTVTATLNLEDSYTYKGEAVEPAYTLSGETTLPFAISYVNNSQPGTGRVTMTLNGETLVADFTIVDGKVAMVNGTVYYYLQEALDAAGEMGLVVLVSDTQESAQVNSNLYLDLNGHSIGGILTVAEGMTLYGVDSTTNDYDCSDGYGTIAGVVGNVALQHKSEKDGALGRILRYLTYTDPETGAVSFHRIYLGITKVTIRPGKSGVGYKAIFGGDEIVKSMLDEENAFGYRLQLDGQDNVVSRDGTREEFITGGEGTNVGLVVSNYDMEYADKKLTAWVTLTLADGTEITTDNEVITSSRYEYTFKDILKKVDEQIDLYSQEQLEGLKNMISSIADQLQEWGFTNLYDLVTATTDPATPAPSKEEI
ncbi:MAG: hypothetical protein E7437_04235 [Ruminococcaceae bacterium]|nr:hypothetical protein [Oscillospiraceae bacterium]